VGRAAQPVVNRRTGAGVGYVGQASDELLPSEQVLWEHWPYWVTSYRVVIGIGTPRSADLDQLD
jgi:hypothetical protein